MSSAGIDHTRQALLDAAVKLFAENGFDATTVKAVADLAGVNISLVSYHFDGKENLYRACLEKFGHARLENAEKILKLAETKAEFQLRLQMFAEEILSDSVLNPDIHRILQRECFAANSRLQPVYKGTLLQATNRVVQFITHAQKKKWIRGNLDPEIISQTILGGLIHFIRSAEIHEEIHKKSIKDLKYREKVIRDVLSIVLEGLNT